jgi:lipopolysaccharide biosynthesis glycosyltransferase
MLKVFIGWDSRFPEPADVLAASIRKHASIGVQIFFLKLDELARRYGFKRPHDPLASTEFTYTRFLVPFLCDYQGKAVFLDNDALCLKDVAELDRLDMEPYALRVVKHDYQPVDGSTKMYGAVQTSYPRKLWSSVMLMDCTKLRLWDKQTVETATGAYLHRFQDIPDHQIGELDPAWNSLDHLDANTKLIHYTAGMVWNKPTWKEDRANGTLDEFPYRDVWLQAYDEWQSRVVIGD